ncbi:MAG: MBOAT family protein [Oscillospiraceae bacterium]|nr:MBOAT family protein [Oscillospiraceae bacterium]
MIFSSLEFLFLFFPVMTIMYFLVPPKYLKLRNLVLFVTSLIFYGWGEPIYVFLMIFSITFDYVYGYGVAIYKEKGNNKVAKRFMIASMITNICVLGFFKYADFFIANLRLIPALSFLEPLNLALPIGISFYTFQTMSYTIDLYKGDAKLQKNIVSFGAFVTLFPQLIAGPILRYKDVDDQLREREENIALAASGARTFLAGLGKKIFLANVAGEMWKTFSEIPAGQRTVAGAWLGIIFYSFQIYFDFSGYSDMAIGLGKILGFKFLENFNYPYISKSITEFWRRWHMSLSTWFRDYVYFPLGGSRCSTLVNYRNLLIVWFLTGFWHGASWNFIVWGLYYFVILVIEKAFLLKVLEKIPAFFRHVYAMFFVVFGWLLFVSESQYLGDLGSGMVYLGNMFGIGTTVGMSQGDMYDIMRNFVFFIIMVIAATPLPKKLFYRFYEKSNVFRFAAYAGGAAILIFGVAYLVSSSYNPFLYFRF